jgi:hypothetical protein
MAKAKHPKDTPDPDPAALAEGIELLREFKPMLAILVRKDLSEEEIGLLIHKRFPPEKLRPLMARIQAVRAALPPAPGKR